MHAFTSDDQNKAVAVRRQKQEERRAALAQALERWAISGFTPQLSEGKRDGITTRVSYARTWLTITFGKGLDEVVLREMVKEKWPPPEAEEVKAKSLRAEDNVMTRLERIEKKLDKLLTLWK